MAGPLVTDRIEDNLIKSKTTIYKQPERERTYATVCGIVVADLETKCVWLSKRIPHISRLNALTCEHECVYLHNQKTL